jgi:hypothetical protein
MTELKILVFGFIFLVRPFSIILDSFQNKIQQKFVLYFQIFQTECRKKSVKINMSFDSAYFHIYISYLSLKKYEIYLTDIAPYFMGKIK